VKNAKEYLVLLETNFKYILEASFGDLCKNSSTYDLSVVISHDVSLLKKKPHLSPIFVSSTTFLAHSSTFPEKIA